MSAASAARARVLAIALFAAALLLTLAATPDATARTGRPNPVGSDRFVTGQLYRGDFPDPSVMRFGNVFYAYSTTIANLNLPVMTSRDLVHWRARGEGLMHVARWAQSRRVGNRTVATTWAPSVARFGKSFVHAYATPVRNVRPRKMCISTSRSSSPLRGFVDRRRTPLICPKTRGAIDPAFFTGVSGGRYLFWKREQKPGSPSHIFVSRLSGDGQRVIGAPTHLLTTKERWEAPLIENPAMVRYRARYYLFYSGGSYADDSYATGYARCASVTGPCTRADDLPLLATGGRVSGPGGAMPFVDRAGRLRLAYAAWDFGNTGYPSSTACRRTAAGCPQRKLHIATLGIRADGSLRVAARG
jgi:beta-xylosidase